MKTLVAAGILLGACPVAWGQGACAAYEQNLTSTMYAYQDLTYDYPLVSAAFNNVLSELITYIQDHGHEFSNSSSMNFADFAPALGTLAAFWVVCSANQPHCNYFLEDVDPIVGSIIFNVGGASMSYCFN